MQLKKSQTNQMKLSSLLFRREISNHSCDSWCLPEIGWCSRTMILRTIANRRKKKTCYRCPVKAQWELYLIVKSVRNFERPVHKYMSANLNELNQGFNKEWVQIFLSSKTNNDRRTGQSFCDIIHTFATECFWNLFFLVIPQCSIANEWKKLQQF